MWTLSIPVPKSKPRINPTAVQSGPSIASGISPPPWIIHIPPLWNLRWGGCGSSRKFDIRQALRWREPSTIDCIYTVYINLPHKGQGSPPPPPSQRSGQVSCGELTHGILRAYIDACLGLGNSYPHPPGYRGDNNWFITKKLLFNNDVFVTFF